MPRWLESSRARGIDWDLRGARRLHRVAQRPLAQRVLVACSRLADGPMWVLSLVLLLLFGGPQADRVALVALGLGAANLALYWAIKRGTRRERPFRRCDDIRACVPAADLFSFPSGHTLHAVSFAVLFGGQFPALAALLWSFAVLVAVSRVVLGVHYPSDVVAGAALGGTTAHLALLAL
jgi:undecaprenyl-diphosphatase